mmetsp:Transcript_56825/g.169658  ORF Transcript_56825/g.169658 Transcript_56825/m.169658 type:complete len:98 (+) Transcript_56825:177-470(+)
MTAVHSDKKTRLNTLTCSILIPHTIFIFSPIKLDVWGLRGASGARIVTQAMMRNNRAKTCFAHDMFNFYANEQVDKNERTNVKSQRNMKQMHRQTDP